MSNQKICMLYIIDTTGSHQFPAMQRLSIAKGHAFVLVYSIASKQSLEELFPIVQTLREVKGDSLRGDVPVMLVGNKVDEESVCGSWFNPESYSNFIHLGPRSV